MTVKADITSTLNGQTAELLLVEDSPNGTRKQQSRSLSGGTEELVFTSLDGGRDKRYTAKVIPSTTDVTQTSEIPYGAEIRIDPIPHRDSDATQKIRDGVEFNNGISASQLGLGSSPLVSGLLTAALNDGEVLADDGSVHESVQAAQDAASSWIFIGPGTFNEAVTIDTAGLTVQGSGYNTLIDGGTIDHAITVSATNVTIYNLSIKTDTGSSNRAITTLSTFDNAKIGSVRIEECGGRAIFLEFGDNHTITNCFLDSVDNSAIRCDGNGCIISNCTSQSAGNDAIVCNGDDHIISNCIVTDTTGSGNQGITVLCDDSVVGGNRVINSGNRGITILTVTGGGNDNIVYNNRVSDSGNSDIDNGGNGTVLDGNNTGASN